MGAHPEWRGIVRLEEARAVVEDHASRMRPKGRELLGLLDCSGRILAEPIHADRDFPPFPRAARDGYAVLAADLGVLPATLEVIGEARAGAAQVPAVTAGQAVAIMTGAAVPSRADAVVMIEHTSRAGNRVRVTRGVSAGDNVVPMGAEGKRG